MYPKTNLQVDNIYIVFLLVVFIKNKITSNHQRWKLKPIMNKMSKALCQFIKFSTFRMVCVCFGTKSCNYRARFMLYAIIKHVCVSRPNSGSCTLIGARINTTSHVISRTTRFRRQKHFWHQTNFEPISALLIKHAWPNIAHSYTVKIIQGVFPVVLIRPDNIILRTGFPVYPRDRSLEG